MLAIKHFGWFMITFSFDIATTHVPKITHTRINTHTQKHTHSHIKVLNDPKIPQFNMISHIIQGGSGQLMKK